MILKSVLSNRSTITSQPGMAFKLNVPPEIKAGNDSCPFFHIFQGILLQETKYTLFLHRFVKEALQIIGMSALLRGIAIGKK